MAKLSIDYNAADRRAVLTMHDGGIAWSQIRRACEDRSCEFEDAGPHSASLSWWEFLSAREAINFYVRKHGITVEFDKDTRRLLEEALSRSASYAKGVSAPRMEPGEIQQRLSEKGFKRELTPEQLRNVSKLSALDAGASFSVPGAGKTTEALAFLFLRNQVDSRLLIVCPKNAFAVWEEQIKICVPSYDGVIVRLVGGETNIRKQLASDPNVALISFQQLPGVLGLVANFLSRHSSFMFVDESHKMKRGVDGVWASSILNIGHLPQYKLVLSGTPMPLSANDLVPQFTFLYPEVEVDEDKIVSLIRPVYVRTTKRELKIPPLIRTAISIPLTPPQQEFYELLRSEFAREAARFLNSNQRSQLRKLGKGAMRLLQFCSNPALLLSHAMVDQELLGDVLASGDSPKIQFACLRARQLASQGSKTIIWSSFVQNVELLASRLKDLGADFIHGGVETGSEEEEETRERKLARFHEDPNAFVLVGNPAACGEGISLHSVCHHAIYVDRNFSVAQYLQSEDRIHRLGLSQDQETRVELLISPGTVDETVDVRLRSKVDRMAAVLEDSGLNIDPVNYDPEDEELDEDDIRAILDHLSASLVK